MAKRGESMSVKAGLVLTIGLFGYLFYLHPELLKALFQLLIMWIQGN
jgi:K+-transporting ATPase KdpF subunit